VSNLFTRGRALLDRGLEAVAAVTLTVSRRFDGEPTRTGAITDAIVGRTVFRHTDVGPSAIEFGERDYLIPVASYIIGGRAVEPADGDRFVESVNGTDLTFEVLPVTGEPAWRYSDPDRTRYRVHVKRVTDDRGN